MHFIILWFSCLARWLLRWKWQISALSLWHLWQVGWVCPYNRVRQKLWRKRLVLQYTHKSVWLPYLVGPFVNVFSGETVYRGRDWERLFTELTGTRLTEYWLQPQTLNRLFKNNTSWSRRKGVASPAHIPFGAMSYGICALPVSKITPIRAKIFPKLSQFQPRY